MTEADVRALCLAYPEAVEGFNMGSTYFKANGKDLARLLAAAAPCSPASRSRRSSC